MSSGLLLLGVVILELVFGNWFSPIKLNRLHIPRSIRVVTTEKAGAGAPPREIIYTRDRYGFRGSYPSPSRIDILTIGGSTTDQRNLTDGETWQDVIRDCFRAAGKEVCVVNAGVNGQSSVGMIKDFEWWFPSVPGLKPKRVLAYVGGNDFLVENAREYDEMLDVTERTRHPIRCRIKECSAFYGFYATLAGMWRAGMRVIPKPPVDWAKIEWTGQPLREDHEELMRDNLAAYAERLRLLAGKIREIGAEPIFVTQSFSRYRVENGKVLGDTTPWLYAGHKINGVDQFRMMQLLNGTTLRVGRDVGVRTIDLAGELQISTDGFLDYSHTNSAGSRKIGQYLQAKLAESF